jgi:hypothetical protein
VREFQSLNDLLDCMRQHGTNHIYCKLLAENDNTKQQIYLGNSFEVLKLLVFGAIRTEPRGIRPNFKAPVPLFWIDADCNSAPAPGAQLILYPDYPEVRLSGFLRGCPLAPSKLLQPIPKAERRFNNGPDGRILFFGVSDDKVFVYLAAAGSAIALEIRINLPLPALIQSDVLREIPSAAKLSAKDILLAHLREFHGDGKRWHASMKLNGAGMRQAYRAKNGGGYTLEALFGIIPNGRSAPDFMGWEIKAYSGQRITLMTPEPDGGFYGEHGVEAFLRTYGRKIPGDVIYFTGSHKANIVSPTSGHTLVVAGFDLTTGKVTDVSGGIRLIDSRGALSAEWAFSGLVEQWGRKHAAAAYVFYTKSKDVPPEYRYNSPVLLGEGTDFQLFLGALASGNVIYDPASKLENASGPKSRTKARSQFRMSMKELHRLYLKLAPVEL